MLPVEKSLDDGPELHQSGGAGRRTCLKSSRPSTYKVEVHRQGQEWLKTILANFHIFAL
jgi:hypothetical protein